MMLLAGIGIEARYGSVRVLHGVNLGVEAGEIVCLLGRNGVGKTTLLRTLNGLQRCSAGKVVFDSADISGRSAHEIARLGVTYAAQDGGVFPKLTVWENIILGVGSRVENLAEVLADGFPRLVERRNQRAGTLSGGEQKMLLTARALLGRPRVALLDEVTEGVQPSLLPQIARWVSDASGNHNVAVVLVEQNVEFALALASRFYILEKGQVVDSGSCSTDDALSTCTSHLAL